MGLALEQARLAAAQGEVPVGAVIVHGDTVVAQAHNSCEGEQDATLHAEILAIRAASKALRSWRLETCSLYVTLEPCPMCMGAALNSRIGQIVYAASEPKAGACGSVVDLRAPAGFNHKIDCHGGLEADASAQLLKDFFRALRERRKA